MICNKKCSVYSRVTGYYRPIENWNRGKQEEFKDRKCYDIQKALTEKTKEEKDNPK